MIKFIDLFAGLGGIRLGFTQAAQELNIETECVFTSEIKPSAIEAMRFNFNDNTIEKVDITQVHEKDIPSFNMCYNMFYGNCICPD